MQAHKIGIRIKGYLTTMAMKLLETNGCVMIETGDFVSKNPEGGFFLTDCANIYRINEIELCDASSSDILHGEIVGKYTRNGYDWKKFNP